MTSESGLSQPLQPLRTPGPGTHACPRSQGCCPRQPGLEQPGRAARAARSAASPPRSCEAAASGAAGVESSDQSRALTGASRARASSGPARRGDALGLRAVVRGPAPESVPCEQQRPGPGRPGRGAESARTGAPPAGPAHSGPPSLAPGPPAVPGPRRGFARPRSGVGADPARAQGRGAEEGPRRCGPTSQRPFPAAGRAPSGAGTSGQGGQSGPGATPVPGRCLLPFGLKVTSGCLKSGFDFLERLLQGTPPTR